MVQVAKRGGLVRRSLCGAAGLALLALTARAESIVPDELLMAEDEVAIQGYNNEPVSTYDSEADFRKMGRGVGMLYTETDGGAFPCTAFLVADNLLLTNHHCGPGLLEEPKINATRILKVSWMADFTEPGRLDAATVFEVNPVPVESSAELDYLVLEVLGTPSQTHPVLPLASVDLRPGMPYWIIGHPMGKSQHISREGCRAADPALNDNRLRHTCDTLGGNSGSPVIDSSTRQVVGLHNAGSSKIGVNFGIPMKLILANSQVLRETRPAPTRPLPLVMTLYPQALGVGEELSVVADAPKGCVPAFVALSPSMKLTPIPAQVFQKVDIGPEQDRYQISAGGRFGLVIEEQDEKGAHKMGFLCGPQALEGETLKAALQTVVGQLNAGTLLGEVPTPVGAVSFAFRAFEVR